MLLLMRIHYQECHTAFRGSNAVRPDCADGRAGGRLVCFIEWVEGPNYPGFLAEDRARELARADLRIDREVRVSDFGNYWLCAPEDGASS
jgi:hypothetical protein